MSRNTFKITFSVSCLFVFPFLFSLAAHAATPSNQNVDDQELLRMKRILDCTCECGLSLAYCEKEDSACSRRPVLVNRLDDLFKQGKRGMELIRAFMGPMHPTKETLIKGRFQGRHVILFFYEKGSVESENVASVLEKGWELWGDRVILSRVDINQKQNEPLRKEFGVYSAPIVLVFAPNGVVTRQFRGNVTLQGLENSFATPNMAEVLRGLQDRRVIFLTVNAPEWKNAFNTEKTVTTVGEILRNSVRIVHVNPADPKEKPFLELLNIDENGGQSLTYVISQAGRIGSRFEGPVSKKDLFLAFQKVLGARSGCGGTGSGVGGNTCK